MLRRRSGCPERLSPVPHSQKRLLSPGPAAGRGRGRGTGGRETGSYGGKLNRDFPVPGYRGGKGCCERGTEVRDRCAPASLPAAGTGRAGVPPSFLPSLLSSLSGSPRGAWQPRWERERSRPRGLLREQSSGEWGRGARPRAGEARLPPGHRCAPCSASRPQSQGAAGLRRRPGLKGDSHRGGEKLLWEVGVIVKTCDKPGVGGRREWALVKNLIAGDECD